MVAVIFALSEIYTIVVHANVLRIYAKLDERFTLSDTIRVVELEDENGHTALRRERHDSCAFQPEVIDPLMVARMKEGGELAGIWIKRTQVSSLEAVTEWTGECQIVSGCCAAVLLSDDVFALERRKRHLLGKSAILTATGCAIEN